MIRVFHNPAAKAPPCTIRSSGAGFLSIRWVRNRGNRKSFTPMSYVANRLRAVLQPYGYVDNRPVIVIDPSGLFPDHSSLLQPILDLLPQARAVVHKQLSCPRSCTSLFSEVCTFTFVAWSAKKTSGENIRYFGLMMSMSPGVIPPARLFPKSLPGVITPQQQQECCQSDIDRTVDASDHITITLTDGTQCKFTHNEFPAGGFAPDPQKVKDHLGEKCAGVLVSKSNPTKFYDNPKVGSPQGVTYYVNSAKRIDIDFTIKVFCGCGGYNDDGTLKNANQSQLRLQLELT